MAPDDKAALRATDTTQDPRVDPTACRAVQARSMLVVPTTPNALDDLDETVLRGAAGLLARTPAAR